MGRTRTATLWVALGLAMPLGSPLPAWAESLATPEQRALDERFVRIFSRPDFQQRVRNNEEQLVGSKIAKISGAPARIRTANEAVAVLMIADDPERSALYWTPDAAREWFGLNIPSGGWILNTPDNLYRASAVDGRPHYEI